jgi:hypothetical protein
MSDSIRNLSVLLLAVVAVWFLQDTFQHHGRSDAQGWARSLACAQSQDPKADAELPSTDAVWDGDDSSRIPPPPELGDKPADGWAAQAERPADPPAGDHHGAGLGNQSSPEAEMLRAGRAPPAPALAEDQGPAAAGTDRPGNIVHLLPPPLAADRVAEKCSDQQPEAKPDERDGKSGAPPSSGLEQRRSGAEATAERDTYRSYEAAAAPAAAARSPTPQEAVHQRAAQRDKERRQRIEARRWIGYEPSRPTMSPMPYMSGTPWQPMVLVVPRYLYGAGK